MSRSVDLFIDADLSLDELADGVGRHVGSPLDVEPDGRGWRLTDGEVQAILSEHHYRDDGDLPFSRYRFALSARLPNDVRPHDTDEATLLRRVAQQIQRGPGWPVLLVHDLQYRDRAIGTGRSSGPGTGGDASDPAEREGDPAVREGDPAVREGDPAEREGDPAASKGTPAASSGAPVALDQGNGAHA